MDSEYDRVRAVSDGRFKYLKNYQPEKPYYQDIKFRLSQKSMQEIIRLKEAGQLKEQQAYWFRNSKPEEELFDTKSDPYEFKNLANNPAYKAKLIELRQKHFEWIKQFGDLGAIPEKELVASWWQGKDKAPETASPEITLKDGKVHISSTTKGASIAYKKHEKDKEWQVYAKPFSIQEGDSLYVIAHRIGFSTSKIVKIK